MNVKEQIITKRVFGLDFIRAISMLLILFSHSSWIYNSQGVFGKIQDFSGFIGVEFFLVLSGFLVGSIVYKHFTLQDYTLKSVFLFLDRRLLRILPNYYLVLIVNIIFYSLLGFNLNYVWKYFFFLQNIKSQIPPFYPETWTLPIKELSYILLVFLLLLFSKFVKQKHKEILFLTLVISLMLGSLFLKIIYNSNSSNKDLSLWSLQLRSVVVYRIDTVMIGILTGYCYYKYPDRLLKNKLLLLGFSALFFLLLFTIIHIFKYRLDNGGSWFWNIMCLPFLGIIICLLLPFFLDWKIAAVKFQKVIVNVCNWSYSIYLIHYSFILYIIKSYINTDELSILQKTIVFIFYISISFVLGFLIFEFFEKPINDYRKRKFILNGRK